MPRRSLTEFELANPLYKGASVTFYTVANGVKTAVKAALYSATTGTTQLENPQKLDSRGKLRQIAYIEVPVIATIEGITVPTHDTGILNPAPTFRVHTTGEVQYSFDGGVSWNGSGDYFFRQRGDWAGPGTSYKRNDVVLQSGSLYVALSDHASTASFATDLAASKWQIFISPATFLQSGTGSVATTLQSKARETYSPADKGAAADGTDDLAELQNMIASVSDGGIVNMKPQASYSVTTDNDGEILISKPLTWMQNGAMIIATANTGTGPHDVIRASSTLGSTLNTNYWDWTETILQGVNTLNVTTTLAANDYALIALGDDPTDATGTKFYYKIVRILVNSGTVLTIDDIIPFPINGTSHTVYKLTSLVNGLVLDGFRGRQVEGTAVPNIALALRTLLGAKIGPVVVEDAAIGVSVGQGCEGIEIESIRGNVKTYSSTASHNRIFTCWGSQNIKVGAIKAFTLEDKNVLYHEGAVRNIHYGNVEIHRKLTIAPTTQVMHFNNADNILIDNYVEASNQGARPGPGFGSTAGFSPNGSSPRDIKIRNGMFYTAGINRIPCNYYDQIDFNGIRFANPRTDEYTVALDAAVAATSYNLCKGAIRRLWVWVSSTTGITQFLIRNSNADTTGSLIASLVGGEWVELGLANSLNLMNTGTSGILVNSILYPQKHLRMTTDGTAANLVVRVRVEYFPSDAIAITNAANNGAGLIRITAAGHGLATDTTVWITGVTGTTEANGRWVVTRIDANNVDLQGSTFTNAWVSGGIMVNAQEKPVDDGNRWGAITWNPGDLADGAGETSAGITVTGAALGDAVIVYPPYDMQDILYTGYVQAANTVEIRIQNENAGANVNLASGVWKVQVVPKSVSVQRGAL